MLTPASTVNPPALMDILANAVADDQPLDTTVSFPPAVEQNIATEVAAQWKVSQRALSLHWGTVRDSLLVNQVTGFRLVGTGLNGWFAVLFDCNERPAFAVRLRVGVRRSVPVALRQLDEGHVIRESDLVVEDQLTWGPPLAPISGSPAPGWTVVRAIDAGEIILESAVAPAPVVMRGDRVKLTWHRGVVTVTLDGIAECDAGEGRPVTVRLRGRRGTCQGTVTGPGRAHLTS